MGTTIKVTRLSAYTDSLRDYQIEVDGEIIGSILNGETKKFDVAPGPHKLRLRISWCSSNTVEFTVDKRENEPHFICRSNMTGWRGWVGALYVLFMPSKYIYLSLADQ